jgi:hypothetical protein
MRFTSVPAVALGVALLAACAAPSDQGASGPLFSRPITFDDLNQTLATGAARLEIELQQPTASGPAIAREVEVQEADDLTDEESIEAGAVRFEGLENSATVCRGSIVLGPFTVQFDGATTEFEGSCAQFVEQVQAAIAAGGAPVVEAERPAPAEPQAPDAATFAAAELKLEGDDDETEVEINVDGDNVLACSSLASAPAGCSGVLQVLGVPIAIVNRVTELESEVEDDEMDDEDFEGMVTAVAREGTSCALGSVTLASGTVVRLVAETELKNQSGDDKQLDDLCEVEAALAAGSDVEADGKGLVTGDSPRTIAAAEVEFLMRSGQD